MANPRELKSEIEQLGNIKVLVESYEEIAASYMRRVRNNVVQKREFLEGLNSIFQEVKQSYRVEIQELLKQKSAKGRVGQASLRQRNGKTILVLLSANTGLYGDIVKRTYNLFVKEVRRLSSTEEKIEAAVIGRLGTILFKEENVPIETKYFTFPDNSVDPQNLLDIVQFLIEYDKIIVFFGQFQSVVTQIPTQSSISGDLASPDKAAQDDNTPVVKYLFEPSLEHILTFFESEIIATIFEQAMHESQLAKFASRMLTLDNATENIKTNITSAELSHQRLKHANQNKKQLAALSGMSLWRK